MDAEQLLTEISDYCRPGRHGRVHLWPARRQRRQAGEPSSHRRPITNDTAERVRSFIRLNPISNAGAWAACAPLLGS